MRPQTTVLQGEEILKEYWEKICAPLFKKFTQEQIKELHLLRFIGESQDSFELVNVFCNVACLLGDENKDLEYRLDLARSIAKSKQLSALNRAFIEFATILNNPRVSWEDRANLVLRLLCVKNPELTAKRFLSGLAIKRNKDISEDYKCAMIAFIEKSECPTILADAFKLLQPILVRTDLSDARKKEIIRSVGQAKNSEVLAKQLVSQQPMQSMVEGKSTELCVNAEFDKSIAMILGKSSENAGKKIWRSIVDTWNKLVSSTKAKVNSWLEEIRGRRLAKDLVKNTKATFLEKNSYKISFEQMKTSPDTEKKPQTQPAHNSNAWSSSRFDFSAPTTEVEMSPVVAVVPSV